MSRGVGLGFANPPYFLSHHELRGPPDGQITPQAEFLSSPVCKNIWLSPSGKSNLALVPSRSERGAFRDRHGRGAGCGGREGALDDAWLFADDEVVWS